MFAPFTSKDRHEAARASAERETRAPFEKRARRALAAVHAADFTAPARRDQNDEGGGDEGHPPRELPVVPVVFDALFDDARRADRTEPVALAARMGFKPVTVPSVSVEWPRDILASVAAAVQVETPEPIQLPTSDDETRATDETGYDLRDLVRGMGADDVHVGPPRHVGSVVAALDEMAARGARAAAVAVEIESTEEAVRRDESFQRAELERREHARAVLMGSGEGGGGGGRGAWGGLGGGGDGGTGPGRGEALMDVAFFVRPGGLHPRTRADDGAGTAPPPMTSPTAREANRLVALVEARPTPPSARDRGAGVIDLMTKGAMTTTTPATTNGGNERREPRPAPPTGLDFEPAISRRVAREISVEVIDDDDAEILDAADRAATERMAAQAAAKDSDMDFVDDIAYPQPSPPRPPRAAPLREVRGGGWNHGAGFHPRSRPSRNPSPPRRILLLLLLLLLLIIIIIIIKIGSWRSAIRARTTSVGADGKMAWAETARSTWAETARTSSPASSRPPRTFRYPSGTFTRHSWRTSPRRRCDESSPTGARPAGVARRPRPTRVIDGIVPVDPPGDDARAVDRPRSTSTTSTSSTIPTIRRFLREPASPPLRVGLAARTKPRRRRRPSPAAVPSSDADDDDDDGRGVSPIDRDARSLGSARPDVSRLGFRL